jgi:hypothetical protein
MNPQSKQPFLLEMSEYIKLLNVKRNERAHPSYTSFIPLPYSFVTMFVASAFGPWTLSKL